MSSLTKRAVILIACRVMNYGVLILSPIFLVRIFDMQSFGQYREFMLYSLLFSTLTLFSIPSNLLYFIPKYRNKESQSITNTALLAFIASILGAGIIYAFRGFLLQNTSYDFILPLIAYVLLAINLDIFEPFWLGRKRTDYVLYFSATRILVRTSAVILTAYATRNVTFVIYSLLASEALRLIIVFFLFRRHFILPLDKNLMKEQLRFSAPLGLAYSLSTLNAQLANLTISTKMGAERLALYSVGSHQIPIINIVRSSVMDVLFPEMAQASNDAERLHLWQRANVAVCFLVFPIYVLFVFFAGTIIELLFTNQYLSATTLFRIYGSLMLIQSFEMGTPLRAINKNRYFILGSILMLFTNLGIILLLFSSIGFITPGIANILSETIALIYLAAVILRLYGVNFSALLMWRKIGVMALSCILAAPCLGIKWLLSAGALIELLLISIMYLATYLFIVRMFRVDEVQFLWNKISRRFAKAKMLI